MSAYDRAHYRVRKLWGKASQYPCMNCGGRARDWAYDGTDPGGAKCSMWPEFYMPMCHGCHLRWCRCGDWCVEDLQAGLACRMHECDKVAYEKGYCTMHYHRVWRHGGPGPAGRRGKAASLEDRFVNNVQVNGPLPSDKPSLGACSMWTGTVHKSGCGVIGDGGRKLLAHRVAFERAYGPIPAKAVVVQICRNKLCVRADHLGVLGAFDPSRVVGC